MDEDKAQRLPSVYVGLSLKIFVLVRILFQTQLPSSCLGDRWAPCSSLPAARSLSCAVTVRGSTQNQKSADEEGRSRKHGQPSVFSLVLTFCLNSTRLQGLGFTPLRVCKLARPPLCPTRFQNAQTVLSTDIGDGSSLNRIFRTVFTHLLY